mmetsp:Transcript_125801/g.402705  ORF Transcript_125801/g.402705 Transcript_125801/m.402705 type:complete len:256 (+) Transcript_125801:1812-2579(+)
MWTGAIAGPGCSATGGPRLGRRDGSRVARTCGRECAGCRSGDGVGSARARQLQLFRRTTSPRGRLGPRARGAAQHRAAARPRGATAAGRRPGGRRRLLRGRGGGAVERGLAPDALPRRGGAARTRRRAPAQRAGRASRSARLVALRGWCCLRCGIARGSLREVLGAGAGLIWDGPRGAGPAFRGAAPRAVWGREALGAAHWARRGRDGESWPPDRRGLLARARAACGHTRQVRGAWMPWRGAARAAAPRAGPVLA